MVRTSVARSLASSLALVVLTAAAGAQAPVFVLDDDGGAGVDFIGIEGALANVPPGAVILVKEGTYPTSDYLFIDRAVQLVAEDGASVRIEGAFDVWNLPAGETVVFRGLQLYLVECGHCAGLATIDVRDCAGTVWIEDCLVEARTDLTLGLHKGIRVKSSSDVVLVESRLFAGIPAFEGRGSEGLEVIGSDVHVFGSTIVGGQGIQEPFAGTPYPGGPGVRVEDGSVYLADSDVTGGLGSTGEGFGTCIDGGEGGPGLELSNAGAVARRIETTLAGGLGGLPQGAGTCSPGAPGPPLANLGGTDVPLASSGAHRLAAASPVRSGDPIPITLTGQPGDAAWLTISSEPAAAFLAALRGPLLVKPPLLTAFVGLIPAGGTLSVQPTVQVPSGLDSRQFWIQGVFVDGVGGLLSAPTSLSVLASSF